MDSIAVVGMGLRFPGRADSAEGLWSVLTSAESQWSEFPADRLNINGFYHPSRNRQGSIPFRGAHFLQRDMTTFDAPFFSVTADEANAVDPQQRMLLEVTYEALENAGIRKEDVDGSSTSVYVGSFVKDYEQVCLRDPDDSPQYAATGNGIALMSNRISYFFNLHGPSETVDTGCSGSLVSIHNAVQSLRSGESSLAIAAGAGLILTSATMMPMTALNFLSPDGKCFTFDARANGYGRGEGIGVVILKRLSDALRDNDTIRAVIRGSSKNQDGRTLGITLPSSEAQANNIRSAYASAGLDFEQTAFVECHGTGTQAGDWRELKSVSETLAKGRSEDRPVVVGSLKPNIGHLEGAAGVAGMIKGILVLEHGKIPPQANYEIPNPDIDLQNWRLKVPRSVLDWPQPGLRRVSVNCFGFGGSNVHLIMDDAESYMESRQLKGNHNTGPSSTTLSTTVQNTSNRDVVPYSFCFSAPDKPALLRVLRSHWEYLEAFGDSLSDANFLRNYAYTLSHRRSKFLWRAHAVSSSPSDLVKKLKGLDEDAFCRASKPRQRICFIFGGQGAQWPRMGHDLLIFKVFEDSLTAASVYTSKCLHSPFSLLDEMLRDKDESIIYRPEISQPATTAVQVALVDLLRSVGVDPSHVIGHSSGEIAAAYACGSITREVAWTIAYWRGFYATALSFLIPEVRGAMMTVGLGSDEVQKLLNKRSSRVQIACINSPKSVTLSGRRTCIQDLSNHLTQCGIFNRILPVDVAYHSDFMKLVSNHYEWSLEGIAARSSNTGIRMFSSVTGGEISGDKLNRAYWATNMVSRVEYRAALDTVLTLPPEEVPDLIIEISPRPQLRSPTGDTMSHSGLSQRIPYISIAGTGFLDQGSFQNTLGTLWENDVKVDMLGVLQKIPEEVKPKCLVDLPAYPWNHTKSYWHESHLSSSIRFRPHGREDLIGAPTADSTPFESKWRGFLRVFENPWLQDHKIQKTIVYPAAGMVCMVLEAAKQLSEGDPRVVGFDIQDMRIEKAIVIPESTHGLEIALNLRRSTIDLQDQRDSRDSFAIYTKQLKSPWQRHATGFLSICTHESNKSPSFRKYEKLHNEAKSSCTTRAIPRQLYEVLDNIGMNYGVTFCNVKELLTDSARTCLSRVKIPDTKSKMPERFEFPHLLHPATLDSMFQTLFAIDSTPMVPVSFQRVFVSADVARDGSEDFEGVSTADRKGLLRASADIAMFRGREAQPKIVIEGLELTAISMSEANQAGFVSNNSHLATEIAWREDITFASPTSLSELLTLLSHKTPSLSILQLGDDESLTRTVLDVVASHSEVAPRLRLYTLAITDDQTIDSGSFKPLLRQHKVEDFGEIVHLSTMTKDEKYDLVLSTKSDSNPLVDLQGLLRESGLLIHTASEIDLTSASYLVNGTTLNIYRHPAALKNEASLNMVILIPGMMSSPLTQLVSNLTSVLHERFTDCNISLSTLDDLVEGVDLVLPRIIVSLLELDEESGFSTYNWNPNAFQAFHKLQAGTKRLLWLTQGCHMKPSNPRRSLMVGLFRTLISEDPLKRYATLDLGSRTSLDDKETANSIFSVLHSVYFSAASASNLDAEYGEEEGKVFVPRLVPIKSLNDLIEPDASGSEYQEVMFSRFEENGHSIVLEHVATPAASLDGRSSHFSKRQTPELGENDIEIDFQSTTITATDANIVSGKSYRRSIGLDVTGTVRHVSSAANSSIKVGDEVTGLVADGSLKSVLHLDHRLAASACKGFVPSLYVAAYFALVHVGRARKGRTVLIQGATNAHGIAAVFLAQLLELNIFATVTGSDIKAQMCALESLGLSKERILDDASSDLEDELRERCGMNSIEIVYRTTSSVRPFHSSRAGGCVVQLGNNPVTATPTACRLGLTLANIDVHSILINNIDLAVELFERTVEVLNESGGFSLLPAIPAPTWQIGEIDKALEQLSEAPLIGAVHVECGPADSKLVRIVKEKYVKSLNNAIDQDGTYLIVGGFSGLGRSIATLLINHGAKHLAFISRSGISTEASRTAISLLQSDMVQVMSFSADICNTTQLQQAIEQIKESMPTIRGVFQCAAVVQDAIFDNMTSQNWQAAVQPKTKGSWNLVESLCAAEMDPFYIFLASSAGVIGNRGQANYAAGNAFEDSMAHMLCLNGKHAVSIDLGPVLGAGMLAEDEGTLDMLRASGFHSINHDDFLKVVSHAITGESVSGRPMPPQVILGVGTGEIIRQNKPSDPYWTRTALFQYLNVVGMPPPDLSTRARPTSMGLKEMLARASTVSAAGDLIARGIREMLAKAMTMLPEEIDIDKPPNAYGVDSLVAIGLRNWVQGNCGVEISLFEVLSNQSVAEMGLMIASRGGYGRGVDN